MYLTANYCIQASTEVFHGNNNKTETTDQQEKRSNSLAIPSTKKLTECKKDLS